MHPTGRQALFALSLLTTLGCRNQPQPPPAEKPAGGGSTATSPGRAAPLSQRELPTTSSAIAVANLEDELQTATKLLEAAPDDPRRLATMATMYLEHGRLLGRLAEYDRAESLAERAVAKGPKLPDAYRARAMVRSRLHLFSAALADLERYAALGGGDAKNDAERRKGALLQALGRGAEARPILAKWARSWPRLETIGQLATLDADEGLLEPAEAGFTEAPRHYPNVTPFPVVWLYLQQGMMWQDAGQPARARALFEAAHERVSVDAAVTSHLASACAATGDRARAIELLRPLVAAVDDPEPAAQLAELLRAEGSREEAAKLDAGARARYEELLARHREAFADHAARFYLRDPAQAARGLELAELNLRLRKTAGAYALATQAALAAGDQKRACEHIGAALEAYPRVEQLHVLGWKAYTACGAKERADNQLRLAQGKS